MYFSLKLDLTWKMKYLYQFHLAKPRYKVTKAYILVHVHKCRHDIFVVTVIQVSPAVELV